jgi:non-canonical (house-cleaning) NTP pyrophosphatase
MYLRVSELNYDRLPNRFYVPFITHHNLFFSRHAIRNAMQLIHIYHQGVPDQPYGDVETREGAMNRAQAAYDAACSCTNDVNMHPDFAVGLEGGLEHQCYQQNMTPEQTTQQNNSISKGELWCMAWIAILGGKSEMCIAAKAKDDNYCVSSTGNKKCRASSWGYAKTGSFLLPPALSDLVLNKNIELGQADDMLFNRVNSKHRQGTVGRLTDGQIDRDEYYVHALKLALIPWIRPELYLDRHTTPDSMEQSKE